MPFGPRLSLALALLATTIAPRSLAEPPKAAPPPKEPVELSADQLDIDIAAKRAVLEGHVRLTKGALVVRAPRVEVRYDEVPNVTWAKGAGGVVAEVKGVRAEAPEVEIDLAKQTLSLRGGVRLQRGAGWISAEKATIDLVSLKVSLTDVKGALPVPEGAEKK
ncbi:LptA/OstA family protein [Polyangium mundeleinium]|uniref:LptA/OstA family protein n=1 Tax=Polyangium mundeleinium TaxID=2995306 RepID=A0ABT5F3F6_9BACT|nr:LptA/OstA family protein [Polyangium mundeleinium]MDC0747672.1 LptA/OstA family protein [Polyangium mundeleinium]